jgi:hypothetical protein
MPGCALNSRPFELKIGWLTVPRLNDAYRDREGERQRKRKKGK